MRELTEEEHNLIVELNDFLSTLTLVYVVRFCFPYEGEDIVGIFTSKEVALREAESLTKELSRLSRNYYDVSVEYLYSSAEQKERLCDLLNIWRGLQPKNTNWVSVEDALEVLFPETLSKHYFYKSFKEEY